MKLNVKEDTELAKKDDSEENDILPLSEIRKIDTLKNEREEIIIIYSAKEENLIRNYEKKIQDLEMEMTIKHQNEMKLLQNNIFGLESEKSELKKEYENRLKQQIDEDKDLFNKQLLYSQSQLMEAEKKIESLRMDIANLKRQNRHDLETKELDYRIKFKEFQKEIKKEIQKLQDEKEELNNNLKGMHEEKLIELRKQDEEHEKEREFILKKNDEKKEIYENQIENQKFELFKIQDQKKELMDEMGSKDKEVKILRDKVENLNNLVKFLKDNLAKKEEEKDTLLKKLQDAEKKLQEKEKLGSFTNKLKNELFRKNNELTLKFLNAKNENEICQSDKLKLTNFINGSIGTVQNVELYSKKLQYTIDGLKKEVDDMTRKLNIYQSDFKSILIQIYDAFQTNNKNEVYRCVSTIYKKFINDDFVKSLKTSKNEQSIREELEKQIDSLEKCVIQQRRLQGKKNNIARNINHQRLAENSALILHNQGLRMRNKDLKKEISDLNLDKKLLTKEISNIITPSDNQLPFIKKSQSTGNFQSKSDLNKNSFNDSGNYNNNNNNNNHSNRNKNKADKAQKIIADIEDNYCKINQRIIKLKKDTNLSSSNYNSSSENQRNKKGKLFTGPVLKPNKDDISDT